MKKKAIFVILIICIILFIVFIFVTQKRDYIFIENNDCFFGMSKNSLVKKLGEPTSINNNISDTSVDEYIYTTEIDNHKATYNFYFLKSKLIEMNLTLENINYDSAISMAKKCMDKQKKYYSDRDGYYISEIEKNNNESFSVSNGVNYGAIGISFDYEYSYGKLTINAIKQK